MFLTEVLPPRIFMISELLWGVLNCLGNCGCLAGQENGRSVFNWLDSSSEGSLELCGGLKYAFNVSLYPGNNTAIPSIHRTAIAPGCPTARSQVEMGRVSRLLVRDPGSQGGNARLLCLLILTVTQSSLLAFNNFLLQILDTGSC